MKLVAVLYFVVVIWVCDSDRVVIENKNLIYGRDSAHDIDYVCQFGTEEEVMKEGWEEKCFRQNQGMQQVVSDVIYYPFIGYGSEIGYILKCQENIPNGDLVNCSQGSEIYSSCDYTCREGYQKSSNRSLTCELLGPLENVSAEWSENNPCEPNLGEATGPEIEEVVISESGALRSGKYTGEAAGPENDNKALNSGSVTSRSGDHNNVAVIVGVLIGVGVVIIVITALIIWKRPCKKKDGLDPEKNPIPEHIPGPAAEPKGGPSSEGTDNEHKPLLGADGGNSTTASEISTDSISSVDERVTHGEQAEETPPKEVIPHQRSAQDEHKPILMPEDKENFPPGERSTISSSSDCERGGDDKEGLTEILDPWRSNLSLHHVEDDNQFRGNLHMNKNKQVKDSIQKGLDEVVKQMDKPLQTGSSCGTPKSPKFSSEETLNVFFHGDAKRSQAVYAAPEGATGGQPLKPLSDNDLPGINVECLESVNVFNKQQNTYRRKLIAALEVIQGRDKHRALEGYMEDNWKELGFAIRDEIQVKVKQYMRPEGDAVASYFLTVLAERDVKVGRLVEYFLTREHINVKAIDIMLEVHNCQYCEELRRRFSSRL